ncbi:hypothetical protein ACF1DV_25905 [Streptomyces achromogenes]|uniref:hypothetical protein n=1 Tax=Streptomyces achromogenes TaxID=67255 RepID=UPI0036F90FB3
MTALESLVTTLANHMARSGLGPYAKHEEIAKRLVDEALKEHDIDLAERIRTSWREGFTRYTDAVGVACAMAWAMGQERAAGLIDPEFAGVDEETVTPDLVRQLRILDEIRRERAAQDARFGRQDALPSGTGTAFEPAAVDIANSYRDACNTAFKEKIGTFRHVFLEEVFEAMAEDDPARLRAELIQAVAVGVKWLEAIDKKAEEDR